MSAFVLDCSIAVAWCFADESDPTVLGLLKQLREHGAVVPAMWSAETANVLLMAERRGRIDSSAVEEYLVLLGSLELDVEAEPRIRHSAISLARKNKLTVYDAIYLELAMRRGLPLATLDSDLVRAALNEGVRTLPR